MAKNILTFCYTIFNGSELLEDSINQIIEHVDNIVLCIQKVSNTGNKIKFFDLNECMYLNLKHKKVHLIYYQTELHLNPKENERRKHNLMVQYAKQLGSTHFIMGAADHFYHADEFKRAVDFAIAGDYDLTASKMFTYYKKPEFQLKPIEEYYMPFVMKMHQSTQITEKQYNFVVDPSVRIEPVHSQYLFGEDELMMHHFSMVRKDMISKFGNSASAQNWQHKIPDFIQEYENAKEGDKISYFKEREIVAVPNYFKIQIKK